MSNSNTTQPIDFSRLLRAAEGLTQWRSLIAGFITFVVGIMLIMLGVFLSTKVDSNVARQIIMALTAISVFIVFSAGFSAVGVMLMDRAKSIQVRSMIDAFVFGLMCIPKFIGYALFLLVTYLIVVLAAALVYFVCKIPGVGPALLFVAHPILVIVAALIFAALFWVGGTLFAPAVWEGRSFRESISLLYAAAKSRLMTIVALVLVLYLVVAMVAVLVVGSLFEGYTLMTTLAAFILGSDAISGGWQSMLLLMQPGGGMGDYGYGGGSSGSGYLYAGVMASALIFGVAASLLVQVLIMGINLVYLIGTEGLDVSASQVEIEAKLEQMRKKAQEAQERARQAAERARQSAQQAAPASPPPAQARPAAATCPNCKAEVTADDVFCGECGHGLKA